MAIKIEGFDTASGSPITGALNYKGSYDAATNTPVLTSSLKGDFYIVSVAGTLAGVTLNVSDHIVFNQNASSPITASMFDVIDNTDAVTSVNTQVGAVVLDTDDISETATNQYFTSARFTSEFNTKDTDNLTEGSSNLYYTNARFDTQLGTKTTDNLTEGSSNLYYTNARFDTQLATKDTDDISEGATNQYFTNTRADSRIAAADLTDLNDVNYTAGAGIDGRVLTYVNANSRWEAVASPAAPVTSVNTQTGAVVLDTDDISEGTSNLYYTNARFDTQLATKDTDDISEGATNLYYTNARFDTQLGTKTTDNLTEGSTNQYFTNTRADSRIAAADLTDLSDVDYTAGAGIDGRVLTYVNANSRWEAVASPSAPVTSVNTQTGAVVLDTDNISEGSSNLYYTNARFDTQLGTKTTDNLTEGASNLYYTNARFDTQLATKDSDDISEGATNQYFTNTRADARISAADLNDLNDVDYTAGAGIDGRVLTYVNANSRWEAVASPAAPVTSVNTQTGAVVLDTDDISETATNQYFTSARFTSQFNTKTTDNLTEGSTNQYFTNTRADARISAANLTSLNDVDYTAGAGIDGRVLTYVNANSRWEAVAQTTHIINDTSPQLGSDLDVNGQDIISVSNGNIELAPDGSGQVKIKGNATGGSGQIVLNCEQNSHGITLKGPPHSATATYTLVFPNSQASADQVLKNDGSGNLSWIDQASGGGGGFTYSAITSASSPVSGAVEYHYSANTSGGAITVNLPAIAAGNAGKEIRVKLKTAGNNLVLSPDGTNQVEAGGAGVDYTLTVQNTAITLVSDGSSNWEII